MTAMFRRGVNFDMATTEFVARQIAILAAAYPSANVTRETVQVYVADLADIPDDVLDVACAECRATCKWFPTIAELRQASARIQSGADSLPPATEAWGEFLRLTAIYANDGDQPPMANPVLEKTVRAMGWRYLCASTNGVADRARFIDLYDEYSRRAVRQFASAPALTAGNRAGLALAGLAKRLADPARKQ
jgi:hypothetical protein